MPTTTMLHIERPEGVVIASGIPAAYYLAMWHVSLDEQRDRSSLEYALLIDREWLMTTVTLQPRDIIVDDLAIDQQTGANLRMQVMVVENFEDHVEARCQSVIGV